MNEIILGDCLEKMKEFPDNFIDCINVPVPEGWKNIKVAKFEDKE